MPRTPKGSSPRQSLVRILEAIVATYGLYRVLHALIELCYGQAKRHADKTGDLWSAMAQALTSVESLAARLGKEAVRRDTARSKHLVKD